MTDDIRVQIHPDGLARYWVVVYLPTHPDGSYWLLTGTRHGRRRARRLADRLTAEAREIMAARQAYEGETP
jgi:hypothetical protein